MKVKVKKLNNKAVIPYKKHEEDFGFDVVATSCEEIAPNVYKYGIGLATEIVRDYEKIGLIKSESWLTKQPEYENMFINLINNKFIKLSLDLRPRSSIWETGMILCNCEGTIDELYRGEISAVFYHVMKKMPIYKVGDRIGQIKLGITLDIVWEEAETLSETTRGVNGFGSTGK